MMQKEYNFLICGYYGAGNLGDDLILDSMIIELRDDYPGCKIFVTVINKKALKKYRDLTPVYYNNLFGISKLMPNISAVIIGGGGLLFEDTNDTELIANQFYGPYGGLSLISDYSIIAKQFLKPIILWSVGIGKLVSDEARLLTLSILNSCDSLNFRDDRSAYIADKIGLTKKYNIIADATIGDIVYTPHKKKYLSVCLRNYIKVDKDIREISYYINNFLSKSYKVKLIPLQDGLEEAINDLKICEDIRSQINQERDVEIVFNNKQDRISESELVIGARLHSIIFSLFSGSRFVAINYDPKVRNFLGEISASDRLVEPGKFTFSDIGRILEISAVNLSLIDLYKKEKIQKIKSQLKKFELRKFEYPDSLIIKYLDSEPFASKKIEGELVDLKKELASNKGKLTKTKQDLDNIINSKTWRYGIIMGTLLKDPKQAPAILKKSIMKILKKVLPQSFKNWAKSFKFKHPYFFNPKLLIKRQQYKGQLNAILKSEQYKGIIVYPPTIDWHMPLFQRPQQLAQAFAREGYLFFYGSANLTHDKIDGFEKIEKNLYVTNVTPVLKDIKDTYLIISWPLNKPFAEQFKNSSILYDYIDELEVFDSRGKTESEMYKNHEYLVRNANLVIATADKLLASVNKLNPHKSVLAPNGVDLSHFSKAVKTPPSDILDIVTSKKRIIGYYGAIAEWFDYDLLEGIAKLRPDYEFVMIGPLNYDKTLHEHKHLFNVSNIHFLGAKKYDELPSYLKYFDVATIPFLVNKITESTSPVKLFEYMAGGRPIVTTGMYECKKYKSVLIGDGAEEFSKKLDEAIALQEDKKYISQLKIDAENNTWSSRAKDIIANL